MKASVVFGVLAVALGVSTSAMASNQFGGGYSYDFRVANSGYNCVNGAWNYYNNVGSTWRSNYGNRGNDNRNGYGRDHRNDPPLGGGHSGVNESCGMEAGGGHGRR